MLHPRALSLFAVLPAVRDGADGAVLEAWVGPPGAGRLLPRASATVSVFDSAVQGGDAAWEGLRVYAGRIFQFERHLARLFASAKALDFKNVHSKTEVVARRARFCPFPGLGGGRTHDFGPLSPSCPDFSRRVLYLGGKRYARRLPHSAHAHARGQVNKQHEPELQCLRLHPYRPRRVETR